MAQKSLYTTYFLWLIGGLFGLHHFYLGRDRHVFLYWITFGGYFGFGWIRDLWKISTYVKDANEDVFYMQNLATRMQVLKQPPRSVIRKTVQIFVADALGQLTLAALPSFCLSETYVSILTAVVPFSVATGVHLVGNIGRHEGKFVYPLVAAYLTYPLYLFDMQPVFVTTFAAFFAFETWSLQWRRKPSPPRHILYRICILALCALLYFSLWASYFYCNCVVTTKDEEEIRCHDAAKHFFNSPIWKQFLSVMNEIYEFAKYHGWKEVWNQLVDAFDPLGVKHAWKVFGLKDGVTQQEIRARYRKLSREWHPDKHQDPAEKELAQEKFIDIQNAYEVLSQVKSHRVAKNVKTCESETCD